METLEVQDLIAPAFEPKRGHRWIVEWQGLDAWTLKTFARPSGQFGEIRIDYINTIRYFQGKFEWQPIEMTLYDPITPSAAQKVMEWVRLGYENATGRAGYKEFYVAKGFKLKLLDPTGAIVERWDFLNIFPINVNFNGLDYANPDAQMINISCRYDCSILQY